MQISNVFKLNIYFFKKSNLQHEKPFYSCALNCIYIKIDLTFYNAIKLDARFYEDKVYIHRTCFLKRHR